MADFHIAQGLQAGYDALPSKSGDTVYICTDTGHCYLGSQMLSPRVAMSLASGKKVYYNGSDVTNSVSLPEICRNAVGDWYGSSGAYDEVVANGQLQVGVLYHIEVQSDWSETDSKHLGYIKNQPNILDMQHIAETHTLKFFYTKYNQVVPYTNASQTSGNEPNEE